MAARTARGGKMQNFFERSIWYERDEGTTTTSAFALPEECKGPRRVLTGSARFRILFAYAEAFDY